MHLRMDGQAARSELTPIDPKRRSIVAPTSSRDKTAAARELLAQAHRDLLNRVAQAQPSASRHRSNEPPSKADGSQDRTLAQNV